MDNLELWNKVKETNPNFTKKVSFGAHSYTTINAQYQIQQATGQFGMYGKTWGIKDVNYSYINCDKNQIMALVNAVFFAPDSEFPISTSIMVQEWSGKKSCLVCDDEFAKKAETDLTTKALSKLGFNADVFLGEYDDNRYVNSLKEKYGDNKPANAGSQPKNQTNFETRKLTKSEVEDKWNGKIYKGNLVYIDNVKIQPPTDQIEKLKKHEKYKNE